MLEQVGAGRLSEAVFVGEVQHGLPDIAAARPARTHYEKEKRLQRMLHCSRQGYLIAREDSMIGKTFAVAMFVLAVAAVSSPPIFARDGHHGSHEGEHSQNSQSTKNKEPSGGSLTGHNGTTAKKLKKLPGKRKPPTLTLH
jgi:hypothetical protein